MRRMTICRSKTFIAFILIAPGAALSARAQTPPPQQPSTAPAPGAAMPATHTVAQGETLWGLAQQYLGDPLLWPEIYRLNTDVVEDPHWIFPGVELRFRSGQQSAAAPEASPTTPPGSTTVIAVTPDSDTTHAAVRPQYLPSTEGPTIFSESNRLASSNNSDIEVQAQRAYRAVRQGEYYSAAFLTEGQPLPSGLLLGNVQAAAIRRLTTNSTASLYTDVALTAPPGDSLQQGQLLLSAVIAGDLRGYGQIVRPTGLLRVVAVGADGRADAQVVSLFSSVTNGQLVLPVEPFHPEGNARPVAVTDGVTGEVVGVADPSASIVSIQDEVFIDRGTADSVRLGDIFAISGTERARADFSGVETEQAEAMVVNVQPHTCTALIITVLRPDVRIGSTARQIRRMPA